MDRDKLWPALLASLGAFWLSLEASYQLLLMLQGIDILTGLIAGRHTTDGVKSDVMWAGIRKKALSWLLVLLAAIVGSYVVSTTGSALPALIGPAAALAFCGVEVVSVLENAERGGVDAGVIGRIRSAIATVLKAPPKE